MLALVNPASAGRTARAGEAEAFSQARGTHHALIRPQARHAAAAACAPPRPPLAASMAVDEICCQRPSNIGLGAVEGCATPNTCRLLLLQGAFAGRPTSWRLVGEEQTLKAVWMATQTAGGSRLARSVQLQSACVEGCYAAWLPAAVAATAMCMHDLVAVTWLRCTHRLWAAPRWVCALQESNAQACLPRNRANPVFTWPRHQACLEAAVGAVKARRRYRSAPRVTALRHTRARLRGGCRLAPILHLSWECRSRGQRATRRRPGGPVESPASTCSHARQTHRPSHFPLIAASVGKT